MKEHLGSALLSLEEQGEASGAAFGLVFFHRTAELPMGDCLWPANGASVAKGTAAVEAMSTENGIANGGEAEALEACLAMNPEAVFFLSDGR